MIEGLLTTEQRRQLAELATNGEKPLWVRVALILLLYDQGSGTQEIAQKIGMADRTVRYWRRKFTLNGTSIFPPSLLTDAEPNYHYSAVVQPSPESMPMVEITRQPPPDLPETPQPQTENPLDQILSQKEIKSPGVTPTDTLAEAGRKVLRYYFIQMLRHEEGTQRGEDIEELHDMRVATRRMRAAMDIFSEAYQPKAIKNHLKGLRRTGRALGRVRDMDVFIDKFRRFLDTQPVEQLPSLKPLLAAWEQERETNHKKMNAYLDSQKYKSFKEKFSTFLNTPGEGARPIQYTTTPSKVRQIAPMLIYSRLASVLAFDTVIENASTEQLHALRIEFKKLRYNLEFFREVLGEETKATIDEMRKMQDHLGDLNDAQVATQMLRDFLTRWDELQNPLPVFERKSPEGIINYLSFQYAERQRLMITFKDAWANFNRAEVRQNLALAVSVL